jgi:hypothetical protein
MSAPSVEGYSAKVEIYLHVAGHKLNVARIRGGQLELRDRIDLPPGDAEVVISVDGVPSAMPVVLANGISSGSAFVEFN